MGFLIVILIVVMFVLAIGSVVSHKKRIGRIATRNKQARLLKKGGGVKGFLPSFSSQWIFNYL